MAVDGAGATYATGFYTSVFFVRGRAFANRGRADAWVGKLDPAGQLLWVQTMGGAEAEEGRAIALAGDSVFVAGVFQSQPMTAGAFVLTASSAAVPDVFVARLNATSGDVLWARAFGGDGADGVASVVAANGLVYLAGVSHSSAFPLYAEKVADAGAAAGGGGTAYLATLAAETGAIVKAEALPALRTLSRMEVDRRTGAVFLVGTDYVARVGAWRTSLEGSSVTEPRRGLALDPSSRRLFVAAPFDGSSITLGGPSSSGVVLENAGAGFFDSYVACLYAATGEVQWARRIGGARSDLVVGLAEDPVTGGVYAAGTFEGQLSSLPAPWGKLTAAGSAADAFLVRYDGEGRALGAWRFGSSLAESVSDVAVDRVGGVYLTGRTDGTAQFGPQGVTQQFVARVVAVRCMHAPRWMYMYT